MRSARPTRFNAFLSHASTEIYGPNILWCTFALERLILWLLWVMITLGLMILFSLLVGEESPTLGERTYKCFALVHEEMLSELVFCGKPFGAMLALMRSQGLIMISLVLLQAGCICIILLTNLTLILGLANVPLFEVPLHSHGCSIDFATNFTLKIR